MLNIVFILLMIWVIFFWIMLCVFLDIECILFLSLIVFLMILKLFFLLKELIVIELILNGFKWWLIIVWIVIINLFVVIIVLFVKCGDELCLFWFCILSLK